MKIEVFMDEVKQLGINTISGVPDSQLKSLCDYLYQDDYFSHYPAPNEGNAVGIASGSYLASRQSAMVYMQNSGIGNIINPLASLTHAEVYDIPMLFVIGWRGEPGIHDEPQHVFQGVVTLPLLELMGVHNFVIDKLCDDKSLKKIFCEVKQLLDDNEKVALIIKKGVFEGKQTVFKNPYTLEREFAIQNILSHVKHEDALFSTTGKISREVYEQADKILGGHQQMFLTVGSMGHTSMIAYGFAMKQSKCRVWCIDGDGAAFMHMGSMALLGSRKPTNYVHILLNNEAHESVGGMPTIGDHTSFCDIARACGYPNVLKASSEKELIEALKLLDTLEGLVFIEVKVSLGSRDNLGRPKESPKVNKENFMKGYN